MKNKTFDPYDFSKKIMDGVPVYYKNFPSSPCIHIRICFNVGSLNDPKEIAGVSHFLEHMIFDGSPKIPTKKNVMEWSKMHALNSWNAWTWFTNTNYHLKCLPEKLAHVLEGMKDMIFNPLLREDDIEHERNVITQEAWGIYKNEKYLKYCRDSLKNNLHGTAYEKALTPLGWPETVAKISQENVRLWHKANYGKGNFFVVVAGRIGERELKLVEKFLKSLPKARPEKLSFGNLKKPKNNTRTLSSQKIGDPREQAEVSFDRAIPTGKSQEEGVETLATALLHDILFERLRTERALCYGVYVNSHSQRYLTNWNVNLKIKEKNTKTVVKEFWRALEDIFRGKEKNRFEMIKKVTIDRRKSAEEVTGNIANEVLTSVWKYNRVITKKSILKSLEKTSYREVMSFLKHAFDKKWTVTETILPSK